MKKLVVILLAGALVLSMAACGGTKDNKSDKTTDAVIEETDEVIGGDPDTWGPDLETDDVQIPSPFVQYDTIEEAIDVLGFDVKVPEITGYTDVIISVMDGEMFEIIHSTENQEICIRKQVGDGDISGDFTEYSESRELEIGGMSVSVSGNDGTANKVNWTNNGFTYSITSTTGLTDAEVESLVNEIA